jgi:site-specific DNA-methyltransferase (adenine-specific)
LILGARVFDYDETAWTGGPMRARRSTTTSNFGAGARESHDATPFYARFRPPQLSAANDVLPPAAVAEPFLHGDARQMSQVADGSVALVVTSPPYFAGKQYEEELEREGVPASYLEYLQLLTDVFAECARKLEPGGRIAVNVANLGRKPYRSLSADVIRILEHDLGLLLRGELIWQKADGANGSCAWGSFRSAANPVLRDVTERVVIASKGRFDRARTVAARAAAGLPHASTLTTDDFLALTLDVWSIPPESARRVGHPAPFPVELPEQLIRLYTFENDLVLDPFMGSGSALVAAALLGRRYVGYDLDAGYVDIARQRVENALRVQSETPSTVRTAPPGLDGAGASQHAERCLGDAGFTITGRRRRVRGTGVAVDLVALDGSGDTWFFDVPGSFTTHRGGLARTDAVWRALGRACALRVARGDVPLVLLTTELPRRGSEGDRALRAAGRDVVFDVVDLRSGDGLERLRSYAAGGLTGEPRPGFWTNDRRAASRSRLTG